jgi:hypothetical protein
MILEVYSLKGGVKMQKVRFRYSRGVDLKEIGGSEAGMRHSGTRPRYIVRGA